MDFSGPLAGILAGFEWMRTNRPQAQWLASFACDCPFFPPDMVERLIAKAAAENAAVAVAASGERHHPVFAVWSASIAATSDSVLKGRGLRKMDDFIALLASTRVRFPSDPIDPFFNINTPDDLERAEIAAGGAIGGQPPLKACTIWTSSLGRSARAMSNVCSPLTKKRMCGAHPVLLVDHAEAQMPG